MNTADHNRYAEIDKRISQANGRLKFAKIAVRVERRGGTLSLRSRLPGFSTRQYISLGCKATPAGLQFAERRARELANDIDAGRFDLTAWQGQSNPQSETGLLCGEWIERFEVDYWTRRDRNQQSETTWYTDYRVIFSKLPLDVPLSPDLLKQLIESIPPDKRQRKRAVQICSSLAKFAGYNIDFAALSGSYSRKKVNPRFLPDDAEISAVRDGISNDAWRWVFGVLACYGLRPHEAFHLDLSDFPVLQVGAETKTGDRIVYPLYPEWAEAWELDKRVLPNFRVEHTNARLGSHVYDAFHRRKIPFNPYDLRHCYARRCFEFSLPPDLGAGLMGHSVQIHVQTYRAWIDRDTYRRAYDALIKRGNRPMAPALGAE